MPGTEGVGPGDERLTEHPVIRAGHQLSASDQSIPDNHCNYFHKGGRRIQEGEGEDNEVFGYYSQDCFRQT